MKVETEATKVKPKTFQTNYMCTHKKTSWKLCVQSVSYITLCADKIRESLNANHEISLPVHQIVVRIKHIHSSTSTAKKSNETKLWQADN